MFSTLRKIGLRGIVYKSFSRLFPNDEAILSASARIGAYRYLKKYKYVLDWPNSIACLDKKKPNYIWLCWLQGYDKAPLLVQKCRDSIFKHNPTMNIIIIDNTNLKQYVSLPDYIYQKYKSGIISHAHYADLIRISLLEKYGGTWIDATVYMTDHLPDYIINSELFCFKTIPLGYCTASNWFISACPNNLIIHKMKSLLFEYWKKENRLVSYSIFHLFWTMTVT
jgi:mannosyltransferase OCH1-like enzyme